MRPLKDKNGQTLLIIVLIMAVALTVGLATVSRSVTDIKISRQEEESARVFSAAEAGIEEALKANFTAPQDVITSIGGVNITAHVSPTDLGGSQVFLFPKLIDADDIQNAWLVFHNPDGSLDNSRYYGGNRIQIYWGNEETPSDQSTTPALEAILIYRQVDYKLARYAIDPNSARRLENNFSNVSGDIGYEVGGKKMKFYTEINVPVGADIIPYLLRLRLLYNDKPHLLALNGTANFPPQGRCYESSATLPTSGISRKVQQCQFYPAPPGVFDYVLYSGSSLSK